MESKLRKEGKVKKLKKAAFEILVSSIAQTHRNVLLQTGLSDRVVQFGSAGCSVRHKVQRVGDRALGSVEAIRGYRPEALDPQRLSV
jgi:hypothetical protein